MASFHGKKQLHLSSLQAEYGILMGELLRAEEALQTAQNNFSYLNDPSAIDVCIYQMQTAQSQYDNILRKLKPLRERLKHAGISV